MTTAILIALLVPVQPQVSVSGGIEVEAHVPTIQFEAEPALVVVAPGVMVVPDYQREVFFADGYYWYNVSGAWFRTRSHRGGWVRVAYARVPQTIIRMPRGQYRHFRGGKLYRRAGRVAHPAKRKARVAHAAKKKSRAATKKKAHAATARKQRKAHAAAAKNKKKARTARAAKPRKTRVARSTRSRKVRSARSANLRRRSKH